MGSKKRIRNPSGSRSKFNPKGARKDSSEQNPPHFSLWQLNKKHCLSKCTTKEKAAFADTLHKLSQFSWAQLKQTGCHALGYEKISRSTLKVTVPRHVKDDVNFIAFRFDGKKAMVGYRDGFVFHVIWLDRQFKVYDHGG